MPEEQKEYRIVVRFTHEMGEWIKSKAKEEGRSRNKQIIHMCEMMRKEEEENAEK